MGLKIKPRLSLGLLLLMLVFITALTTGEREKHFDKALQCAGRECEEFEDKGCGKDCGAARQEGNSSQGAPAAPQSPVPA